MRLSIKVADTMILFSFLQDANRNIRVMMVMICFKVKCFETYTEKIQDQIGLSLLFNFTQY